MDQITGLNQSLYANDMDYDAEYLDTKNYPDDANRDLNYQTLKYRLANHDPYDVILAGDDAALSFVERYRNELFKNIPVVFFAVNTRLQPGPSRSSTFRIPSCWHKSFCLRAGRLWRLSTTQRPGWAIRSACGQSCRCFPI